MVRQNEETVGAAGAQFNNVLGVIASNKSQVACAASAFIYAYVRGLANGLKRIVLRSQVAMNANKEIENSDESSKTNHSS